jgi:hypothetical protein
MTSAEMVGKREELGDRVLRVAEHDEKRAEPGLAQVERGLKEHGSQVGTVRPTDRLAPDRELAGDVQQPPAGVAEAEDQRPPGEDLDLLGRGQDQADVSALSRRLGVVPVGYGAGMDQRLAALGDRRPAGHVDQPHQVTLVVDQEHRSHPVAEPVEPLDCRQPCIEIRRAFPILAVRRGRIVLRAQEQRPHRDPPVLVGRQRRHPQRLQRRGDAIGADRCEIIGNDQVLGLIAEPIETMSQLLDEQSAEPQVDRRHDHFDHSPLRRQQRHRVARLERQPGPQPLDLDPQAVGVLMQPEVRLVRAAIPVDDAPIPQYFELGTGEEMLQGAPEYDLVDTNGP